MPLPCVSKKGFPTPVNVLPLVDVAIEFGEPVLLPIAIHRFCPNATFEAPLLLKGAMADAVHKRPSVEKAI